MSSSSKVDDSEPPPPSSYITPPALIAFTLALIVVCFVGFSVLYFCRFYFVSILHTRPFQRSGASTLLRRLSSPNDDASSSSPYRGLDPLLLQAFPTFLYASVKDLRKDHKYSFECAICLLEFEDDSMLRLLNPCCHVFHQECIDLWLSSNKTCPVCRKHLDSPINGAQKYEEQGDDEDDNVHVEEESMGDVCIDVKEDEVDHHRHHDDDDDEDDEAVSASTGLQQHRELRTFARSHSTGHSIIMNRGEDEGKDNDKYTLRLREHVAVIKNVGGGGRGRGRGRVGHNHSKSCSSYRDVTRPNVPCSNCGYVETVSGCSSRTGTQHI